jgi:hypothetical protein
MYLAYGVATTVSMSITTLGLYCVVLDAAEIPYFLSRCPRGIWRAVEFWRKGASREGASREGRASGEKIG